MPSTSLRCRLCDAPLHRPVIDLGATPLANSFLAATDLGDDEPQFPLRAYLCASCQLLQLEAISTPSDIFSRYAYFSSYSQTLLRESERYAQATIDRLELRAGDSVMEVASNDGYLLQFFHRAGLKVLGVEPARNVAAAARERGIPTVSHFFGTQVAETLVREHGQPRLLIANNVVAHVPDINDFFGGLRTLLAPDGTLSIECHHVLSLVRHAQFDNIYHEHFQYFSLHSLSHALAAHGLTPVDVEEIPAQGGSLRVSARHAASPEARGPSPRVAAMLALEDCAGLGRQETYATLALRIADIRVGLRRFLEAAKEDAKSVVCFGAAAKGNTLLNYCGVHDDLVDYAVDSSPHKQGHFLPGSHIQVHAPSRLAETKPDYVLILPWNISEEIMAQMDGVRAWGGQFVVPVPTLRVLR
ncbi:MAG: class I SAM-dependent methyltransferase [Vicinamibacterales bacterium]